MIRAASVSDLASINEVIDQAIMTWDLPERVKRLALSSYQFTEMDFNFLQIAVYAVGEKILAVTAWEEAETKDLPGNEKGLLVYALYVDPNCFRQGVGKALFDYVKHMADEQKYTGLLVKAQTDANEFFEAQGMHQLADTNQSNQYSNRWWLSL